MGYETKIEVPSVFWVITFVLLTMPITGICLDIYVPSLPAIQQFFGTEKHFVQLTVSLFVLGNAFSQLIFGTLSDVYGRRRILLFGSFFFTLSAFLATVSTSIYFLLIVRFCEGIAVAACTSATRAMVPDVFKGLTYKKVITMATTAWALGPIVAPFIGGYLQHYFDWHAPFYFLMGYGLLIFAIAVLVLPETHLLPTKVNVQTLAVQLKTALRHPVFLSGSLIAGLSYGFIVIFNVMGPFLVQTTLDRSAIYYGYIALLLGIGLFIGNLINRLLVRIPATPKIRISVGLIIFLSFCMVAWSKMEPLSIISIVLPTFVIFLFSGIIMPNAVTKPFQLFPSFLGFATSLASSLLFFVSFVMTVVASFVHAHTLLPLALLYGATGVLSLFLYVFLFSRK